MSEEEQREQNELVEHAVEAVTTAEDGALLRRADSDATRIASFEKMCYDGKRASKASRLNASVAELPDDQAIRIADGRRNSGNGTRLTDTPMSHLQGDGLQEDQYDAPRQVIEDWSKEDND